MTRGEPEIRGKNDVFLQTNLHWSNTKVEIAERRRAVRQRRVDSEPTYSNNAQQQQVQKAQTTQKTTKGGCGTAREGTRGRHYLTSTASSRGKNTPAKA